MESTADGLAGTLRLLAWPVGGAGCLDIVDSD